MTLLIQPDTQSELGQATIEPKAYQVTDQAVALHRDRILERPHKNHFCAVRQPSSPDDFVAPVIYRGNDVDEIDVVFLQIPLPVTVSIQALESCQLSSVRLQ